MPYPADPLGSASGLTQSQSERETPEGRNPKASGIGAKFSRYRHVSLGVGSRPWLPMTAKFPARDVSRRPVEGDDRRSCDGLGAASPARLSILSRHARKRKHNRVGLFPLRDTIPSGIIVFGPPDPRAHSEALRFNARRFVRPAGVFIHARRAGHSQPLKFARRAGMKDAVPPRWALAAVSPSSRIEKGCEVRRDR